MLVAAGVNHEQIVMRNAHCADWKRSLSSCAFVITDALTAKEVPKNIKTRISRLITEKSLGELQTLVN